MELNYYWSDDFSASFYIKLAKAGFISTSMPDMEDNLVLLPEIQFEYAILDFENLHISKKVQKLLNTASYELRLNSASKEVLDVIENYHTPSWLEQEYKQLMEALFENEFENFELKSFELFDTKNNQLIAGEIGYVIGKTYTSLTGFTSKEKAYNHWGKLQLVLLSQYLQNHDFAFWNLGHASLQYKIDLGAKVYSRKAFLKRWLKAIDEPL